MTGRNDGTSEGDISGAPVDFDRLHLIVERLSLDDRFDRLKEQPPFAPDRVVCVYDPSFYPNSVRSARLGDRVVRERRFIAPLPRTACPRNVRSPVGSPSVGSQHARSRTSGSRRIDAGHRRVTPTGLAGRPLDGSY